MHTFSNLKRCILLNCEKLFFNAECIKLILYLSFMSKMSHKLKTVRNVLVCFLYGHTLK